MGPVLLSLSSWVVNKEHCFTNETTKLAVSSEMKLSSTLESPYICKDDNTYCHYYYIIYYKGMRNLSTDKKHNYNTLSDPKTPGINKKDRKII